MGFSIANKASFMLIDSHCNFVHKCKDAIWIAFLKHTKTIFLYFVSYCSFLSLFVHFSIYRLVNDVRLLVRLVDKLIISCLLAVMIQYLILNILEMHLIILDY